MRKILLIEDLTEPAEYIITALRNTYNWEITWITGVIDILSDDCFEVLKGDGQGSTELELSEFDLALIDYEIEGAFEGAELVKSLRDNGVVCVGTSGDAALNGEIMAAGAHYCYPKHAVAGDVESGTLDLEEVIAVYGYHIC